MHYRHVCAAGMRERPSFLALCHYKDLHVATMFPGEPGGLGDDRGHLCCDRDFPTLCRDRNSVLRQTHPIFGSCAAPWNPLGHPSHCLTILSNTRRTGHSPLTCILLDAKIQDSLRKAPTYRDALCSLWIQLTIYELTKWARRPFI